MSTPTRTPAGRSPDGAPAAPRTLFCLPHAGGIASRYAGWRRGLQSGHTVLPLDLPGHGTRRREPVRADWPELVTDLTAVVLDRLDRHGGEYVLGGHSLGALLAYDVARALHATGRPPQLLLVLARNGPSAELSYRPLHRMPDDQLLATLHRLGGIRDQVAGEPALLQHFLPVLRTDLRLAETYTRAPGPPLPCPIALVAGRRDQMTDHAGMLAWQQETTGTFDLTVVDDGHFLLDHPDTMAAVASRLGRLSLTWPRSASIIPGQMSSSEEDRGGLEPVAHPHQECR